MNPTNQPLPSTESKYLREKQRLLNQNTKEPINYGVSIKTLTVELVGVVVTVADTVATFARIDAPVIAGPLARRIAG